MTGAAMRTTALQYAASAGLLGMLALATATGSFGQMRTGTHTGIETAQYCMPQDENSDAHRFYCRNDPS
jgi:hypothetical protein